MNNYRDIVVDVYLTKTSSLIQWNARPGKWAHRKKKNIAKLGCAHSDMEIVIEKGEWITNSWRREKKSPKWIEYFNKEQAQKQNKK